MQKQYRKADLSTNTSSFHKCSRPFQSLSLAFFSRVPTLIPRRPWIVTVHAYIYITYYQMQSHCRRAPLWARREGEARPAQFRHGSSIQLYIYRPQREKSPLITRHLPHHMHGKSLDEYPASSPSLGVSTAWHVSPLRETTWVKTADRPDNPSVANPQEYAAIDLISTYPNGRRTPTLRAF